MRMPLCYSSRLGLQAGRVIPGRPLTGLEAPQGPPRPKRTRTSPVARDAPQHPDMMRPPWRRASDPKT
eukprot:5828275-Pyramimonas_sp.AAC.1